ncbi:MAG: hypothetical protein HY841_05575 [Bacteroidetes bacterium]|nr:hypothetical protein [Bacteroidota bacterium]
MKTKNILPLLIFSGIFLSPAWSAGWIDSTLFSPKLFIENRGQFDKAPYLKEFPEILFAVNHINTKIFFSSNKIAYTLHQNERDEKAFKEFRKEESKKHSSGFENEEELKYEQELKSKVFKSHMAVVDMEWLNANANCKIIAEDVAKEYFNYGMDKDIRQDINFVHGYKKIIYKNLYNGIDVEYSFHPTTGIKYNIIVHPGADVSKIKLKYSGAQSVSFDNENNIVIKTSLGNIIDHAPISFQDKNGEKIKSKFILKNNILSFQIDEYDKSKTLIIDPWVSSTLPTLDTAYEIAVDPAGNVFVYGDFNSQVVKYNSTGTQAWTFLS